MEVIAIQIFLTFVKYIDTAKRSIEEMIKPAIFIRKIYAAEPMVKIPRLMVSLHPKPRVSFSSLSSVSVSFKRFIR